MNDASHMIADLIQGDESVAVRDSFIELSPLEIKKALQIINDNKHFNEDTKRYLLANTWAINYKQRPPTMEEFLGPEWLGSISESVFPYWKDLLIDLANHSSKKQNLILYSPIGTGKSFATAVLNLYVCVLIYLMRDPKKTLKQSHATVLCNVFMAQSIDKATEILLEPFINILTTSEKFFQCRTMDQMNRMEKELPDKVAWTTAGRASALTIGKNMGIKIKTTANSLLGLTILMGSITELAFFKEVGYSDEDIMKLYNGLKERIASRFPIKNGFNYSIIDTSPNDATFESSLDYWVMNIAHKDESNLIFNDTKWALQPWLFPEWEQDKNKVFWIHKGDKNNQIPKVYEAKEEVERFDTQDIVEVPIDVLQLARDDPSATLKNYAGIPTASSNRLIQDNKKIENVFSPNLKNLYSHIIALENEPPEELIWDKIKNIFFVKLTESRYEFWRNPHEVRFVSVDQALSIDTASIAVTHPELNKDGSITDVVDMTVNLIPNKSRINLDAIKFFIHDLFRLGKLNIGKISFDQFQSDSTQQYLKRQGFDLERLSVDRDTTPYLNLVQSVNLGRIKAGRNIYIKNNLKSLKMSTTPKGRPKVEHEFGKVENSPFANDNWETSSLGFNAKDATDAIAASIELRKKYYKGTPRYIYEESQIDTVYDIEEKDILKKNLLRVRKRA